MIYSFEPKGIYKNRIIIHRKNVLVSVLCISTW